MTAGFITITTADGTVIATDPDTGMSVSGRSLIEATAELRRVLARMARGVHTHACEVVA